MKLNVRLILISFAIVLGVSVSSTYIFYWLAGNLISRQQDQNLLYSANDFVFALQNVLEQPEEDFNKFTSKLNSINEINLNNSSLDFIFTLVGDSLINFEESSFKKNSLINNQSNSFKSFFVNNPGVVLRYRQLESGKTIYYGNIFSSSVLDSISNKIRAEVAVVIDDNPVEVSHYSKNQVYLPHILKAATNLKFKNNFDLFLEELENVDFLASLFTPRQILTPGGKINFVVFDTYHEASELRSALKTGAFLLVITGSAITFIFVLLLTAKLRKQISLLSQAAEVTKKGDLDHRVEIISHDEVGKLGDAFNSMLDNLKQNKIAEKDYTEFITLINQNPTLKEVSDSALTKIIKSTGLTFGVLYVVDQKTLRMVSSFGIGKNIVKPTQDPDFYSNAIEKREVVEFEFHENFPEIKTGLASIKIKYLLVFPIVNNKETIAILELASESIPNIKVRKFIESIQEQLAVGLINARSLEQLENLVEELQVLNEEYQKQNKQIIDQNEKLKEFHFKLQEKAEELEGQRAKAVELTKVKSQFLASMSHELRTPLISILGLTELMAKDPLIPNKSKDRIHIVHRNGKKLLSLITNILEFSKFESGRIELKKESFLFNDLLEEIKPVIKQLAEEKKLIFEIENRSGNNLLLNTDKTKLEQVLNNLLINAVKFTEMGKIKLTYEVLNNDVVFSVSDTGIGISEENKKIIFSEFQQVDSGTSRKFGGAGLGLAICKRYVEMLGSSLELKSELGLGSQFSFVLHEALLDTVDESDEKYFEIEDVKLKDEQSVLLIADSINSEKLIGDFLFNYNYKITLALTYEDGLKIVKSGKIDYIISTLISGNDIWNFISKVKNEPKAQSVPIFLIPILEEEKIGWCLNIDEFISKPFAPAYLNKHFMVHDRLGKKISDLLFVSKSKSEYEILKSSSENKYHIDLIESADSAISRIKTELPDLIFIDIETIGAQTLDLIYAKQNGPTKDVPLCLLIPESFNKKLSSSLTENLKSVSKIAGSHAIDVLNDLKERLKISDKMLDPKSGAVIEPTMEIEKIQSKSFSELNSRPTILVVDDDSDSLFTIGEFIKEMDYDTIFAHNGMECLLTLNHVVPDLILLDIMMPQMDGFETIKRIKSDKRFTNIPIIALTAYAMLENRNVIEKNGFNDLVTKPVDSRLLSQKIKENLLTTQKS